MNDLDLAHECRARHPDLKVLMLTGSPVVTEIEAARYPCLKKPMESLRELDLAVGQLLARPGCEPVGGGT
jgi:hypothetical protein